MLINLNYHVPNILILLTSFDNKHAINVTIYIGFDVYAQFQKRKEKNVKGCTWKKTTYQYLKLEEWRQKIRQDVQLRKN